MGSSLSGERRHVDARDALDARFVVEFDAADAAPAATLHIMPLATLLTAVVAFLVGGALGWWPLAAWTQRSMTGERSSERMPLRTVRIAAATITAVTFAALALRFGLTWILPALLVFAASATVLTLVDLAEKRLPNAVIFPTLGAVAVLLVPASWAPARGWRCSGRVVGSAAMFAVYFLLALISPSSMGMGDVKLALVIGLLLGWFGLTAWLIALLAAFVVGGVIAIVALAAAPSDTSGFDPVRPVDARRGIDRPARRRFIVHSGYTTLPPERGTGAPKLRGIPRFSPFCCAANADIPRRGAYSRGGCTVTFDHPLVPASDMNRPVPAGGAHP